VQTGSKAAGAMVEFRPAGLRRARHTPLGGRGCVRISACVSRRWAKISRFWPPPAGWIRQRGPLAGSVGRTGGRSRRVAQACRAGTRWVSGSRSMREFARRQRLSPQQWVSLCAEPAAGPWDRGSCTTAPGRSACAGRGHAPAGASPSYRTRGGKWNSWASHQPRKGSKRLDGRLCFVPLGTAQLWPSPPQRAGAGSRYKPRRSRLEIVVSARTGWPAVETVVVVHRRVRRGTVEVDPRFEYLWELVYLFR